MSTRRNRLGPYQLLTLYWSSPGRGEDKILSFANALTDYYLNADNLNRVPLSDLNLPNYTYNSLRRAGLAYVDELIDLRDEQILQIKNIGDLGLRNIQKALAAQALAGASAGSHASARAAS